MRKDSLEGDQLDIEQPFWNFQQNFFSIFRELSDFSWVPMVNFQEKSIFGSSSALKIALDLGF